MVATSSLAPAPVSDLRTGGLRLLLDAIEGYLDRAGRKGGDELRALQPAPFASLPHGAGGLALAFLRAASTMGRDQEHAFAQARRWLRVGGPGWRAHGALTKPDEAPEAMDASLYYGGDGLRLVRLELAIDSEEPKVVPRLLAEFLDRCRVASGGSAELMQGGAGYLAAMTLLHRRLAARPARDTSARRSARFVREVASPLAHRLLDDATWQRDPRLDLSHGRAGVLFALLGWSLGASTALPGWFPRALDQLADEAQRAGRHGAPEGGTPSLERSFCHGATGHALLWARAYERFGDSRYLERARTEARCAATETPDTPGNLCCGYAGRAYAALALDRIDAAGAWYPVALSLAQRAVDEMTRAPGRYPHGLLRGWPGLVCLVSDLCVPSVQRRGVPLVEG